MATRERELAEQRHKIEERYAKVLLAKREKLPRIAWSPPPDFEAEAARKVHEQNLARLGANATVEELFHELAPHLYEFSNAVVSFERLVLPGLPREQRYPHTEQVVRAIVRLILPGLVASEPLPPGAKGVRLGQETQVLGTDTTMIAGPFEIVLDRKRRPIAYRRAPYAERQGVFQDALPAALVGILRAPGMKGPYREFARRLRARLRAELTRIAGDSRTRREMADEAKGKHSITDKQIAQAADVSLNDFYQWRANHPRIGPKKHRRILYAVCAPAWPPPALRSDKT